MSLKNVAMSNLGNILKTPFMTNKSKDLVKAGWTGKIEEFAEKLYKYKWDNFTRDYTMAVIMLTVVVAASKASNVTIDDVSERNEEGEKTGNKQVKVTLDSYIKGKVSGTKIKEFFKDIVNINEKGDALKIAASIDGDEKAKKHGWFKKCFMAILNSNNEDKKNDKEKVFEDFAKRVKKMTPWKINKQYMTDLAYVVSTFIGAKVEFEEGAVSKDVKDKYKYREKSVLDENKVWRFVAAHDTSRGPLKTIFEWYNKHQPGGRFEDLVKDWDKEQLEKIIGNGELLNDCRNPEAFGDDPNAKAFIEFLELVYRRVGVPFPQKDAKPKGGGQETKVVGEPSKGAEPKKEEPKKEEPTAEEPDKYYPITEHLTDEDSKKALKFVDKYYKANDMLKQIFDWAYNSGVAPGSNIERLFDFWEPSKAKTLTNGKLLEYCRSKASVDRDAAPFVRFLKLVYKKCGVSFPERKVDVSSDISGRKEAWDVDPTRPKTQDPGRKSKELGDDAKVSDEIKSALEKGQAIKQIVKHLNNPSHIGWSKAITNDEKRLIDAYMGPEIKPKDIPEFQDMVEQIIEMIRVGEFEKLPGFNYTEFIKSVESSGGDLAEYLDGLLTKLSKTPEGKQQVQGMLDKLKAAHLNEAHTYLEKLLAKK